MPEKLQQAIAAEVRAEMARQEKTQRQLGAAIGLPQASVSKRLSGVSAFRAHELVLVASFLGKPVQHFTPTVSAAGSAA